MFELRKMENVMCKLMIEILAIEGGQKDVIYLECQPNLCEYFVSIRRQHKIRGIREASETP